MNIRNYKDRLLRFEAEISARTERETGLAREPLIDYPADAGDVGSADETASENFTEAELDLTVLKQVRDALRRIDNGTFGACTVDGGPIEATRLEAVPWTPYCLKHQALLEAALRLKTPTL